MLGQIFGFPVFDSTAQNSAANSMFGQLGQSGLYNANQAASNAHAAAMAQQQMAQYNAAMMRNQQQWMVNGIRMDFTEFLDEIAPGEDNPMRTFLILKYKK